MTDTYYSEAGNAARKHLLCALITGQIRVGLYHEQKKPNSKGTNTKSWFMYHCPRKKLKRTTVNLTSGSLAVATNRVPLIDKALIQGNGPLWSLPLFRDSILSNLSHCKSPLAPFARRPGGIEGIQGCLFPNISSVMGRHRLRLVDAATVIVTRTRRRGV